VTVVVVTFNSARVVPGLVASLADGLGDLTWQLVVADNASQDDTVEVVQRLAPEAIVLPMGRNAGYAAGINAAAAAVGSRGHMLVLNPDVRLGPGCVPELVQALDERGIGIAVPRLLDGTGALVLSMRRRPTVLRALADALVGARRAGRFAMLGEIVTDPDSYTRPASPDWAEGSTQLISSDCVASCWPWDEGFFLYSEETEFHLRARDRGFAIRFVPTAVATHLGGESTTSSSLWSLLVANRVRLFAQRHGPLRTTLYWSVLLVRESSRAALGKQTSRAAARALLSPRRMRAVRGPGWLT
jgi:GT2 family glycosyltransferase